MNFVQDLSLVHFVITTGLALVHFFITVRPLFTRETLKTPSLDRVALSITPFCLVHVRHLNYNSLQWRTYPEFLVRIICYSHLPAVPCTQQRLDQLLGVLLSVSKYIR